MTKNKRISAYLPEATVKKLRIEADKNEMSISTYIKLLIENELANKGGDPKMHP